MRLQDQKIPFQRWPTSSSTPVDAGPTLLPVPTLAPVPSRRSGQAYGSGLRRALVGTWGFWQCSVARSETLVCTYTSIHIDVCVYIYMYIYEEFTIQEPLVIPRNRSNKLNLAYFDLR